MRRRSLIAGALALAAAPLVARAQAPGKKYRVALSSPSSTLQQLTEDPSNFLPFNDELRRLGFVEVQHIDIWRYSGSSQNEQVWDAIAHEIVASNPDVIVISTATITRMVMALTKTIPIVFSAGDPVGLGLVESIARPGGNVT